MLGDFDNAADLDVIESNSTGESLMDRTVRLFVMLQGIDIMRCALLLGDSDVYCPCCILGYTM